MSCFSKYIKKDCLISIDYDSEEWPPSVRFFKPTMYIEDEKTYCCILGPDPEVGIFGCGPTPLEAAMSWDKAYQFLGTLTPAAKNPHTKGLDVDDLWVSWKREA
jgi:hypothetical protein